MRLLRRPATRLHLLAGCDHFLPKRISGPLLDRIDIHVQMPRVDYDKLSDQRYGEASQVIRARVEAARQIQRLRFQQGGQAAAGILCNADMRTADLRLYCALDDASQNLMRAAMAQMHLSARSYHRILKLARTISDLDNSADIKNTHLAEALQYRPQVML